MRDEVLLSKHCEAHRLVKSFIRKTNESGCFNVLGHTWEASKLWCHRLVRVDLDLTAQQLRIYALRRRDPTNHTLLVTHEYDPPTKRFHE